MQETERNGLRFSRSFGSGLVLKDEGRVESVVRLVNADGPAAALRPGDVIVTLNGQPLESFGTPPFELWWQLQAGIYRLEIVGSDAQGNEYRSPPVEFRVVE